MGYFREFRYFFARIKAFSKDSTQYKLRSAISTQKTRKPIVKKIRLAE